MVQSGQAMQHERKSDWIVPVSCTSALLFSVVDDLGLMQHMDGNALCPVVFDAGFMQHMDGNALFLTAPPCND